MAEKLPSYIDDLGRRIGLRKHSIPSTGNANRSKRVRPAGRVDNRHRRMMPAHQAPDFDAVSLPRHVDVGDQQGEYLGRVLDQGGCLVASLCFTDVMSMGTQLFHENVADKRLILYNQHAHSQILIRKMAQISPSRLQSAKLKKMKLPSGHFVASH